MLATPEKNPDRFVLRLNPELYEAISTQAELNNRSINGEICTALDSWLYQYDQLMLVKNRVAQAADEHTAERIMSDTPVFPLGRENGECKIVVRLKDSQRDDLKSRVEQYKGQIGGFTSQNAYAQMVLVWWLTFNYELREFSKSLYQAMSTSRPCSSRPRTHQHPEHSFPHLRIA